MTNTRQPDPAVQEAADKLAEQFRKLDKINALMKDVRAAWDAHKPEKSDTGLMLYSTDSIRVETDDTHITGNIMLNLHPADGVQAATPLRKALTKAGWKRSKGNLDYPPIGRVGWKYTQDGISLALCVFIEVDSDGTMEGLGCRFVKTGTKIENTYELVCPDSSGSDD